MPLIYKSTKKLSKIKKLLPTQSKSIAKISDKEANRSHNLAGHYPLSYIGDQRKRVGKRPMANVHVHRRQQPIQMVKPSKEHGRQLEIVDHSRENLKFLFPCNISPAMNHNVINIY